MTDSPWITAALLKDRTRRAIRDRARAGEPAESIANDYGVPVDFVQSLIAPELFEDTPLDVVPLLKEMKWQLGVAGRANIITFDGEDIVGVGYAPQPDSFIEKHNKAVRDLLALVEHQREEIATLTLRSTLLSEGVKAREERAIEAEALVRQKEEEIARLTREVADTERDYQLALKVIEKETSLKLAAESQLRALAAEKEKP